MADSTSIIPIKSLPGVKRDGTRFEGDQYVDALWARFQRGLPRKIGGYRLSNKYLTDIPRTLHGYARNDTTYFHAGSATKLERFFMDSNFNTSTISDRTPSALVASSDNMWQFDVDTIPATPGLRIVAQVAPNLSSISNSSGGQLFQGDAFGTAALTEVTALPTDYSLTGGVVALHPYTFAFGNDGFVMWSPDPSDFTVAGAGAANVTGQKLVRGLPLRGGPGSSPSGLLWSVDSLIRASYIGGTPVFQFDTISAQIPLMAAQSIIEYDGIFYWLGVDRFLSFNGVVREIENGLNSNFFFDNLNFAHRQKIFAFKVPRFGEIWWCFPFGSSTEPNHAIIYNVRENTWYDTALPGDGRGAGVLPSAFHNPILSGVEQDATTNDYKLWVHEYGVDEIEGTATRPIRSYFETADISLPVQAQQNNALQVVYIEPDFVQTGDMTVQVKGRANARAPEFDGPVMSFPDTATTAQEQIVYLKEQRRELRFRFSSDVVGGDYQMGLPLAHVKPGDGTTIG
jgi:hypothetical protein